jgi:D-beta-D-heptose 7-phosphate kinase/D-beta-D-heptose 1-phosphate adenosyltransferase
VALKVPDFSAVRALVAGDAMLDEYWFGDAARISPEAPVPVVKRGSTERRPGGAANVALNVAALGGRASLCAVVGEDENGRTLEGLLEAEHVECRLVRSPTIPTLHKLRVLARSQQLIRLDAEHSLSDCHAEVTQLFSAGLAQCDIAILSDYGKGTLADAAALIAACRAAGKPVLVDPKGTEFRRYAGATGLTPNQGEFEAVAGPCATEGELFAKGEALRAALGLEFLLVTRGERGMVVIAKSETPLVLEAEAREVFDVTGAGDTVIALLAAGISAGLPLADATRLANLGAGLVVGKIGVAAVSRSELSLALHRRGQGGRGLVTADELETLVHEAKGRGERVVMTNGCFDILHSGHVSYLEEARSLGDHLIVAVNDDASVRRLKGDARPVVSLEDRMAVLSGLAAVDWVVPFSEDTPAALIERMLPDVLVKGGDWRPEQIAGAGAVVAAGGEVRVLAFKAGRSTTAIIDAIRASPR